MDTNQQLLGIGLYTPAEAGRLIDVSPSKLIRWLRGHDVQGTHYARLWTPEIDLDDEKIYLSFRDLLEARIAARFIERGLSAQKVRLAINLAREMVGERPLSTTWLRTDGRTVFLQVVKETGAEPQLIDLFKKQFAFNAIVEKSFKDVDFDGPIPRIWWPQGKKAGVLLDPRRAFGQPIEQKTSIPTEVLANAAEAEGSPEAAARVWDIPVSAVKRALSFQAKLVQTVA